MNFMASSIPKFMDSSKNTYNKDVIDKARQSFKEFIEASKIYKIDITPFAPNDSDKFHMLISRNPSSQDFSVENLRKAICNLFEVSNACMTFQIKELALNG